MEYAVKGYVRGRVQGVGFREFIKKNAVERDVRGSATNLSDGRVEVILKGSRAQVNEIQHLVANGPPAAVVNAISWELVDNQADHGFVIA